MTALRVRVGVALLAAATGIGLSGSVAWADDPVRLLPGGGTPATAAPNAISHDSLGPPVPDALGLLDAGHGGLPATLWANTDRHDILSLLASVPVASTSPARAALTRRLLLTSAIPPTVADGKVQPPDAATSSLLSVRVARLLKMGATNDVRALVEALPVGSATEDMRRAVEDSYLIDNDTDHACHLASDANRQTTDPYWLKVLVFCDLLAGKRDKAGLEISLLGETKDDDPVFSWATEQLSGGHSVTLGGFDNPQPLTMAMVRATGRGYPAGTLVDAQPWLLRAVAKAKIGPSVGDREANLAASEAAARNGGIAITELATAFSAFTPAPVKPSEPPKTVADLVAHPSASSDALLWQMANATTDGPQRAEIIARALEAAAHQNWALQADLLYAPLIEKITPAPTLLSFVEPATRALLASGNLPGALVWYQSLQQATDPSKAIQIHDALWPLVRLAGGRLAAGDASPADANSFEGSKRLNPERLTAWQALMANRVAVDGDGDTHEPPARHIKRLQTLLLSLLTALGEPVPLDEWSTLWIDPTGDAGFAPSAARWQAARLAMRDKQTGATVALALMMLAGAEPGEESAMAVSSAVESLQRVGLDSEAHLIAVEAAVAAGL